MWHKIAFILFKKKIKDKICERKIQMYGKVKVNIFKCFRRDQT